MRASYLLASLALGCGRIGFDAECATSCTLAPWEPFGDGHGFDSTTRIVWGSASGGGVSNQYGDTMINLAARFDDTGHPVVAYLADDPELQLFVRRFDGTAWQDVAPPRTTLLNALVALGANGDVLLAASDGSLERFTGAAWSALPPVSDTSRILALAEDAGGAPLAAYVDPAQTGPLAVARFDGAAWQPFGAPVTINRALSAKLVGGATPALAWRESAGDIFLRQWNGAWDAVGESDAPGFATGIAFELALDGADRPVLAWANGGLFGKRWDGAAWVELAPGSTTAPGLAQTPADRTFQAPIALAARGDQIALSWEERTASSTRGEAYLRSFDGATWTDRERIETAATSALLGFDGDGRLHAAAQRRIVTGTIVNGGHAALVLRYRDAGAWQEYGPTGATVASISATPDTDSYQPSLAVAADGRVEIAWTEGERATGLNSVYVRSLDGVTWRERAAGDATGRGISGPGTGTQEPHWYPSIAIGATQTWVMWRFDLYELLVRRWTGAAWDEAPAGSADVSAGGLLDPGYDVATPRVIVDGADRTWAAWASDAFGYNVYAATWDGAAWQPVGPDAAAESASGLPGAFEPVIAGAPDGTLYMAYRDARQVYVMHWSGSAWEDVAGSRAAGLGGGGLVRHPAIAVDATGRPWLAWAERPVVDGTWQVHVTVFDGAAWHRVGGDSVSGSASHAIDPAIVIDSADRPWVAWADHGTGSWEIYARRWIDDTWQEVTGSATAGGISNSSAPSRAPVAIAVGDRICVAWSEDDRIASEVRGRCIRAP